MTEQDVWTVQITLDFDAMLPADVLRDVNERIDHCGFDGSVSAVPQYDQWVVSFGVQADSPLDALYRAQELITKLDVPHSERQVAVEILSMAELERRADAPTMPTLVGSSEVAGILGVSRQRVHQLRQEHKEFPTPLVQVASGPLWDERAIEKFAREWERKSGAPRGRRVRV